MAWLYVDEFDRLVLDALGQPVMSPLEPPLVSYRIAITGSSVPGPVFDSRTRFIQYHTDAICSIAIDISPTAVVSTRRIAANETRFPGVQAGQSIAVIANT